MKNLVDLSIVELYAICGSSACETCGLCTDKSVRRFLNSLTSNPVIDEADIRYPTKIRDLMPHQRDMCNGGDCTDCSVVTGHTIGGVIVPICPFDFYKSIVHDEHKDVISVSLSERQLDQCGLSNSVISAFRDNVITTITNRSKGDDTTDGTEDGPDTEH